ncbi:MAG: hypothetical protein WD278_06720 [Pirellulales bacterium]
MPSLTVSLQPQGPIVSIAVAVSAQRQDAMTKAGFQAPLPVQAVALIDTGASCTCIDPGIIQQLGLVATGSTSIVTPSTGAIPHQCNQYDVSLSILLDNSRFHRLLTLPVIETDLANAGVQALIGRDVLSEGILIYNGCSRTVTLSF